MIQQFQRHPFLKWAAYFAIWTLISLAFAGQAYLTRAEIGSPVSWGFALAGNLVDWYTFAILSLPVLWLAARIPIDLADWRRRLTIHLVASILFSIFWMLIRAVLRIVFRLTEGAAPLGFWETFKYALVATFFFNILIYWVIISVAQAIRLYRRD